MAQSFYFSLFLPWTKQVGLCYCPHLGRAVVYSHSLKSDHYRQVDSFAFAAKNFQLKSRALSLSLSHSCYILNVYLIRKIIFQLFVCLGVVPLTDAAKVCTFFQPTNICTIFFKKKFFLVCIILIFNYLRICFFIPAI